MLDFGFKERDYVPGTVMRPKKMKYRTPRETIGASKECRMVNYLQRFGKV